MSFWPRSSISPYVSEPSFTPLFRLLDDFDTYRSGGPNQTSALKSFQPKFDVKEVQAGYELHGELPGIEQKDVEIEFTDAQTLTIRGRTERQYESGTRPSTTAAVEAAKPTEAITEGGEENQQQQQANSHQPTVEDDADEPGTPTTETSELAKHHNQEVVPSTPKPEAQAPSAPKSKYWVSERSVGEFSRSFSFPVRVDQDQVTASMKNGVLSILVPKAKKHEAKKINIE